MNSVKLNNLDNNPMLTEMADEASMGINGGKLTFRKVWDGTKNTRSFIMIASSVLRGSPVVAVGLINSRYYPSKYDNRVV